MSDKTKSPESTETILNSIADGVFTVNRDWKVTSFNRAAEQITGITRNEAMGQHCCDVFRASICETNCALRETLKTGKQVVNRQVYIVNSEGNTIPISISTALLKNREGEIIGGVETFRDLSTVEELRKQLSQKYSFQDIISKNSKILEIFDILPGISESDSTILIEGESGTGKELMARAVHNLSPRKDKPMIAINCGALPDTLLESELFGYKAGAFTDAKKDKPGRFALAEGGTILLDEIGDVSPALQIRLLRVIQEKVYEPLGSVESVKANVRIIAATNRKLEDLIQEGKFREDLYYRINVIKIKLPALRERKDDIPVLAYHFISKFNHLRKKTVTEISPEVMSLLMDYDFPGNVRELENIIEHAFVLNHSGTIESRDLPETIRPDRTAGVSNADAKSIEDIEKQFIFEVLKRNNWNRTRAAKQLSIHKTTLWRKMKKYHIQP